jgi:hypothetical protein
LEIEQGGRLLRINALQDSNVYLGSSDRGSGANAHRREIERIENGVSNNVKKAIRKLVTSTKSIKFEEWKSSNEQTLLRSSPTVTSHSGMQLSVKPEVTRAGRTCEPANYSSDPRHVRPGQATRCQTDP